MAMNRFKSGVAFKEQEDRNLKRSDEVMERLHFRVKKRMYTAIKSYANKFRCARIFMKTLVHRLDKFNKEAAYRRWKDAHIAETRRKIMEN